MLNFSCQDLRSSYVIRILRARLISVELRVSPKISHFNLQLKLSPYDRENKINGSISHSYPGMM